MTMSRADDHSVSRILESAVAEDSALRVHEAAAPVGVIQEGSGPFAPDGSVLIHIMRPCKGQGRGRHVYEAAMLQREAPKFKGWPMFIDHESPEAQRRSGGLPPSINRLGGEVLESWWDGNVPAEGRYGQGAVMGRVMPSPWMREVIKVLPRQVQASMNTFATNVKPMRDGGVTRYVVEGFADEGSVDWVTKAGAGGRIVQIMESYFEEGDSEQDEELANWLQEHRPAVVEAVNTNQPTHGDDEEDEDVKPEQLIEAFDGLDDEGREKVAEAVLGSDKGTSIVTEAINTQLREVLPTALEAAGNEIEEAALAKVDERLGQGDLKAAARAKLEEAELADWAREDALARVEEAAFTPVAPDETGEGGKSAREVMESVVDREIERVKKLQEAAGWKPESQAKQRRTTVRGNGDGAAEEIRESRRSDERVGDWRTTLQEGGIKDPASAYAIQEADAESDGKRKGDE